MDPMTIAMALGALKSLRDKQQQQTLEGDRVNELRLSPWTHQDISKIEKVSPSNGIATMADEYASGLQQQNADADLAGKQQLKQAQIGAYNRYNPAIAPPAAATPGVSKVQPTPGVASAQNYFPSSWMDMGTRGYA